MISSSVFPFSHPQSFQHQGLFKWVSFHIRWPKYWNFSFSIRSSNEYWKGWFPLELTCLFSCPRDSQEYSPASQFKSISSSVFRLLQDPTLTSIHDYWKTIALTIWTFVGKVMSLFLNMLSRFDTAFLPRNKHHSISWWFTYIGSQRICLIKEREGKQGRKVGEGKRVTYLAGHWWLIYTKFFRSPEMQTKREESCLVSREL